MRFDLRALWIGLALGGCSGRPSLAPDASDGAASDSLPEDASADASAGDSGVGICGNGVTDEGEVCDGNSVACPMLGGSWSAGMARCRASCGAWDVSACTLRSPGNFESVKPAERDPARWASARCNDGTPFGFLISLAPMPSHDWVIQLEGGGYCDDATMRCAERQARLTTTLGLPDRGTGTLVTPGLFSRDAARNPSFSGANIVQAHYCSSDFWSRATTELRPSAVAAGGWYYSGRANVRALFALLTQRYGLDDQDPALRVLFGGNSAGAVGAHINSAFVAQTLPRARADGRLTLLLDAPWFLDWDDPANRIVNATVRDREVWRTTLAYWGSALDPECVASVREPVDCFFGRTWYPIVSARMRTFVQQSQLDEVIALALHPHLATDAAGERAWRAQMADALGSVSRLFSGSTSYHVLTVTDRGWATGPAGSTLQEMVSRFFNDGPPERVTF